MMFKTKKNLDARAQRSRNALLKSGLELLNSNKEASLSEIATHANVGRATLYRQFETREQLIKEIAIYSLESLDNACKPIDKKAKSALDAIQLMFEYTLPLTQELQFLMQLDALTEDDPDILKIYDQQQQETIALIEMAKQEGSINKELPTLWMVNLIEGLFYSAALTLEKPNFTSEQVARFAFKSFSSGVRTE